MPARATSHGSLGTCVLNGIGASYAETMQPGFCPQNNFGSLVIVADVLFLRECGFHMALNMLNFFAPLTIGSIVAGAMTGHVNWQLFWQFKITMFAMIDLSIVILVAFTETKFVSRAEHAFDLPKKGNAGTPGAEGTVTQSSSVNESVIDQTKSFATQ